MGIAGHLNTLGNLVWSKLRPPAAPPAEEWSGLVSDPRAGDVRLTGRLTQRPSGEAGGPLVLAVHGLGGSADSSLYLRHLVAAAGERDWSILRVNLRGADRLGGDFYHAGLTADLHAALASPGLAGYDSVVVVGFSLGGHVTLRLACESEDPRLRAVAAVSAPLDLAAGQRALDRPGARIYLHYALGHLKEIYRAFAANPAVPPPLPPAEADRIGRLWDWDDTVVSARHGFSGAADYYARVGVAPLLGSLRMPALLVAREDDPIIPAATVLPSLDPMPPRMTARWVRGGGHLAFPARLDLGYGPRLGLPHQLLGWCEAAVR
jgi:predicted alpha/beta-fold hydrolase